ncbi:hypothetical protein E8E13_006166 [Curvularia kusanoi]|uniref:Apple domain-containing protein n=1 Tax=Curvularia kusanoi TaxID=90978 RepID=A0A9P4T7Y3_CURKU|nr:hypothetical protein E8E13_006166 [Curvularia kusanoi]
MKHFTGLITLAAVAAASPFPQFLNLAAIIPPSAVAPNVTIPMGKGAVSDVLPAGVVVSKRAACDAQPLGSGPTPSPDTDTAFLSDSDFSTAANGAVTPGGYTLAFANKQASSQTSAYLGYYTLTSYDTGVCAQKCNAVDGCISFNVLFERDPTVEPGPTCDNPPSTTVIKCVLWGTYLTADTATNNGQWRDNFHVVIAGSNGYNREDDWCSPVSGYSCQGVGEAAVISPPQDCHGNQPYLTYQEFTDGAFSAQRCADACASVTGCQFFNTYILLKNGVPQGQICSMYTQSYPDTPEYVNNQGQYAGSDHYTIARSEIYSNSANPGSCPTRQ